jgi:hypothetical protein
MISVPNALKMVAFFWHRQPDFLGLTNETGKADVFFIHFEQSNGQQTMNR